MSSITNLRLDLTATETEIVYVYTSSTELVFQN